MRKKIHMTKELIEQLSEMKSAYIDKDTGLEMGNPVPHTLILDDEAPLTMLEQMKRFLRNRGESKELTDLGVETIEDALDLDIVDDHDAPLSQYQRMNDEFVDRVALEDYRAALKKMAAEKAAKEAEEAAAMEEFRAWKAAQAKESGKTTSS